MKEAHRSRADKRDRCASQCSAHLAELAYLHWAGPSPKSGGIDGIVKVFVSQIAIWEIEIRILFRAPKMRNRFLVV